MDPNGTVMTDHNEPVHGNAAADKAPRAEQLSPTSEPVDNVEHVSPSPEEPASDINLPNHNAIKQSTTEIGSQSSCGALKAKAVTADAALHPDQPSSGSTSSITTPGSSIPPPQSDPSTSSMRPPPPKQAKQVMGPPPPLQPKASMAPPPPVMGLKPFTVTAAPVGSDEPVLPPVAAASEASTEQPASSAKKAGKGPVPPAPAYNPPPWAGVPEGIPYTLEVLKNGSIVDKTAVSTKPFYTFGRHPTNDWCQEHPSVSRLHAVLVYKGETGEAFLFDAGSTHGTIVNKKPVKAKVHVPLRVGDTFKLGSSTRLFILGGPTELMPEEGLSREQKRQLAQLHAAERQRQRELESGAQQMQAAMGGGATWGMQEDAVEEEAPGAHIDWRAYSQTQPLTDHQRKIYDKIRKAEHTMNSLKDQMSKIQAKEKHQEGGLTVGQAKVLVDAEVKIEQLVDQLEDLEDLLTESIAHSISGKSGQDVSQASARKRKAGSDDDDSSASDSDDEFYDRTATRKKKKQSKAGSGKKAEEPEVENAATLHGKKSALLEEKQRLERALQTELAAASQSTQPPAVNASTEAPGQEEGVDSLDAFMTNIGTSLEQSKVTSLKSEIADINQQLQRVERLLTIADPSGLYNPNKQSAQQARARALQLSSLEQKRKAAAAEALAKAKASAAQQEAEQEEEEDRDQEDVAAAEDVDTPTTSLPEVPAERLQQRPTIIQANPNPLLTQLGPKRTAQIHIPNRNPSSSVAHRPSSKTQGPAISPIKAPSTVPDAHQQASTASASIHDDEMAEMDDGTGSVGPSGGHTNGEGDSASGQDTGNVEPGAKAAASSAQPLRPRTIGAKARLKGPDRPSGISFAQLEKDAAAKVAQQLELLSKRGSNVSDGEPAGSDDSNWKPPENQTGDGRTKLNDLYGY